MPQRREGLRSVFRLLGSLAVVLIPFGLYTYFHLDRQYDYHVSRNFRVLTEAGEHLSALLRQFESLFDFDPYNEIEKAGYPFRTIVKEKFSKEENQDVIQKFLEEAEDVESTGKTDEERETAKKIRTFRKALKEALDKEKKLRSLENSLGEEAIKVELRRFPDRDTNELASALGAVLQSRTESDTNLTRELSYPPPKLVRLSLETVKNEVEAAWKKVATTQREALQRFDGNVKPYNKDEERTKYIAALEKIQKGEGRVGYLKNKVKAFNKTPAYNNLKVSQDENDQCEPTNLKEPISLQIDTSTAQTSLNVVACPQREWSGLSQNLEAKLPLADLMRNTDAAARNFGLLVLAQEDGKVLYSSETNPVGIPQSVSAKFASLKPFFPEDQSETKPEKAGSQAENDQKDKDGQVSLPRVSVIRDAEVSGTTYRLFLQPFHPPLPVRSVSQPADGQPIWYLGGIIRKSEFQKKSLAISLIVTGLVMLGLSLGFLALPYIKLFFTNAGEPLRALEIFFLVVSLILGGGLATLLLLNTVAYHNMRAQFDGTAEDIRENIKKQFRDELYDTLKTLSVASHIVPSIVKEKEFREDISLGLPQDGYPLYESVFWVEKHGGLELENWATYERRKPTKGIIIDISKRQYFTRARDEWELWQKEGFYNFFIERVHSYTDGVKTSAISTPYKNNKKEPEDFKVAVLSKRFLSFRALALPPSFGFAVIEDNTGKVLFHSDDRRSLIENFFWETDENPKLQAAVQRRQKGKIAGYYNGRKHHFFVTPVDSDSNVPWSLVVFYDTQLLETVNFEIGVIAAGIFLLYVVLFALWITLIHFSGPRELWSWCWPQSKFQNRYAYVAALLSLVVVGYGLGIWLLEGWPFLLLVMFLCPFVLTLLHLYFTFKRKLPMPAWSEKLTEHIAPKLSFRLWYLSIASLSLLIISVLPIAAIFKDVSLTQAERFTKFRESEFFAALKNREKTLRDDMCLLAEPSEVDEEMKSYGFIEGAIELGLYEYEEDEVCLHKTDQNGHSNNNARDSNRNWHISERFIDFLPVYNELAGKLRYPMSEQSDRSQSGDVTKIQYQAQHSLPVFLPREESWSPWIVCLGLPIFLLVLFVVIRELAKRTVGLYLSDFEVLGEESEGGKETTVHQLNIVDDLKKGPTDEWKKKIEGWAKDWTDTDKERRILVRPPQALVSELKKHANQNEFIDLSSPTPIVLEQLEWWTAALSPRIVLVTNFELGILDSQLRRALLKFLERVWAEIPVILCSSLSPLYHLITPEAYPEFDKGAQNADPKIDEELRWSSLLSTFRKERFWYKAADWRKQDTPSLTTLSRECCWADELIPIHDDLKDKVGSMTEEQIIHQVGDRAEAFYRKQWILCTKEERLALMQLAQGNLVNPQNDEVIRRLLWCNLIQRDPDLRLANESFTHFVLTAESPARIAEWEKGEADGSTWTMLRAPFVLLLVLVAAFLSQTGGEGMDAMIAIVSSVLAGLPIIIRAVGFLRGGQTGKLVEE